MQVCFQHIWRHSLCTQSTSVTFVVGVTIVGPTAHLTVRLLGARSGTGTTSLLGLSTTGISNNQGAVIRKEQVLNLPLGGLINVCKGAVRGERERENEGEEREESKRTREIMIDSCTTRYKERVKRRDSGSWGNRSDTKHMGTKRTSREQVGWVVSLTVGMCGWPANQ